VEVQQTVDYLVDLSSKTCRKTKLRVYCSVYDCIRRFLLNDFKRDNLTLFLLTALLKCAFIDLTVIFPAAL